MDSSRNSGDLNEEPGSSKDKNKGNGTNLKTSNTQEPEETIIAKSIRGKSRDIEAGKVKKIKLSAKSLGVKAGDNDEQIPGDLGRSKMSSHSDKRQLSIISGQLTQHIEVGTHHRRHRKSIYKEQRDRATSGANMVALSPSISEDMILVLAHEEAEESQLTIKSKTIKALYRLCDILFSCFFVLPLAVGFVHGVWGILNTLKLEIWQCWIIGMGIPTLFYYFQDPLAYYFDPFKMKFVLFFIVTRFLLIIHCLASVFQWKAVWDTMDKLFPPPPICESLEEQPWYAETVIANNVASVGSFLSATILAIGFRVFSNVLTSPICVGVDEANSIFTCPLRYNSTAPETFLPKLDLKDFLIRLRYLGDCIFSVIVIQTLVIIAWRGCWFTIEFYLFTDQRLFSILVSAVFGLTSVVLLALVQPLYYRTMTKLHGHDRIAILALINMGAFLGCVTSFRAIWEFFDMLEGAGHYEEYGNLLFSETWQTQLLTALVSTVLATFFGILSAFVVRGAVVDGELAETVDDDWAFSYASLLQKRQNSVPFPEPWVLRFICTNQKLVPPTPHPEPMEPEPEMPEYLTESEGEQHREPSEESLIYRDLHDIEESQKEFKSGAHKG